MAVCAALALLVGVTLRGALAYNVDVDSSVVYRGPAASMFGFSVAAYTDRNDRWVLVGAPKADTAQRGVVRGGAVYKCSAEPPNGEAARYRTCQQIPLDPNGNNMASGRAMDSKSGQWFGATLTSAPGVNNTGVVVACAPRYLWFSSNRKRREPVGTCYVAMDGFSRIDEYSPCRTDAWGFHRQGSCQAGFGSAINKDGDQLFIGAVGSWYWQGRLFSQHLFTRPDLAGTSEGPSSEDDSYLGYSVATGQFSGGVSHDVVVGMPRGNNLTGKVLLYTSSLKSLLNISGDQIGSYFGYSLCVADLNGDKLDDVVIGAPFFTDYSNTEGKYDTGQVVIAYQSPDHSFKRMDYLRGKVSQSRFGLAITSLGDIDLDGFDDIAVGAPHDGSGQQGAVFIYHGTKNGINSEPTQVITPSALGLSGPRLLSFGYSLHGGLDLDGNQYPDVVVGAYDANSAVYLRSRPVVHVQSSVKYQTVDAEVLDMTDQAAKCLLDDARLVPCVSVLFCMTYDGVGVDRRAEFEVQFRLDARRPKTPRLFFRDLVHESRLNVTARVDRAREWCHERYVYVEDTVRDKLTPLVTEVHYSLVHRKPSRQRSPLQPILNLDHSPVASDSISIQKNCGRDDVCVPDLQLTARPSHSTYLLGSRERLTLDVTVFNTREDAFEAMLFLTLPVGVDYVVTERANDSSALPVLCSLTADERDEMLHCHLGNPLPAKSKVHFFVHLMPQSTSEEMQRDYQFSMSVNSTNHEPATSRSDNDVSLTLPIRIHTELLVLGISLPESVHYNASLYTTADKQHERDIGPELYHVYEISNRGPSDIVAAELYILWPTYTLPEEKHLLYLLEQPQVEGPGSCDLVPGVNPLQLKLAATVRPPAVDGAAVAPPYRRMRRSSEAKFQAALGCGPTVCTKIYCRVGPLSDRGSVIIRVRTRLWLETIDQENKSGKLKAITVSSKLVARVTGLPHQVDPSYMNYTAYAVKTRVLSDEVHSAPVPWWVIVLASCGGVLILLLLIFILYKLGFFKRRRRPGSSAAGGAAGNGAGKGTGTGTGKGTGNGGTKGRPSYYGYQNVPYVQPGDEAL